MTKLLPPFAALAIAAVAVPAAAEEPGSRQTRDFVQAAGNSDAFEMLEGYTALAESKDPDVRAFAQQMIRDHGETSRALQQATARAGLTPPPMGLNTGQSEMLAALQSLQGRDFDQAYARQQALAHRSALVVQQGYAQGGDDPLVRQVAAGATRVVSGHLAMADQLSARLGGS